jgi:Protein of unknown function (DUF3592)
MRFQELFLDAPAILDQLAVLLAAAVCATIGALLAGNRLYWRLRAKSVPAIVAGVRAPGKLYYAVYRYKLPSGKRMEATADVGASANPKLVTGRKLRLLVIKKHPDRVAEADTPVVEMVGWFFFAAAAIAVGVALSLWPITEITWTALGAVVIFALYRLRKSMPARGEPPFSSLLRELPPAELFQTPVRPIEEIFYGPVRAERQRKQRITGLIVTPILVLVGIGVFALGAQLGRTAFLLQSTGEHVRGTVLFCELKRTLHGSSYYPVVQFATRGGMAVQFRDNMGSNPPAYRDGEPVTVLYFPAFPQQSATIDRGLQNWIAPGALCLGGTFLAIIAIGARLGAPRSLEPPRKTRGGAAGV